MGPDEPSQEGKSWESMTMEEKLAHLLKIQNQLINVIQPLTNQVYALQKELREHRHDEEGKSYIKLIPGSHNTLNGNPSSMDIVGAI